MNVAIPRRLHSISIGSGTRPPSEAQEGIMARQDHDRDDDHYESRERDETREHDWRTGPGSGYEGSRRHREGQIYGADEHGTQQWGEGRYGDVQDREWRE